MVDIVIDRIILSITEQEWEVLKPINEAYIKYPDNTIILTKLKQVCDYLKDKYRETSKPVVEWICTKQINR